MSDNAKVLEILKAISQAASKSYDGAYDDEGKPVKIGFKREVDNVITQSRTMDGAKCRIQGCHLIVSYHSEIKLEDVYRGGKGRFENEIRGYLTDYANWLKKEYKKHTTGTLELTEPTEPKVLVERTSNVRAFVTASCLYTIANLKKVMDTSGEELIAKERKEKAKFTDEGGHGKEQKGEKNKRGKEPKKEKKKLDESLEAVPDELIESLAQLAHAPGGIEEDLNTWLGLDEVEEEPDLLDRYEEKDLQPWQKLGKDRVGNFTMNASSPPKDKETWRDYSAYGEIQEEDWKRVVEEEMAAALEEAELNWDFDKGRPRWGKQAQEPKPKDMTRYNSKYPQGVVPKGQAETEEEDSADAYTMIP